MSRAQGPGRVFAVGLLWLCAGLVLASLALARPPSVSTLAITFGLGVAAVLVAIGVNPHGIARHLAEVGRRAPTLPGPSVSMRRLVSYVTVSHLPVAMAFGLTATGFLSRVFERFAVFG